MGAVTEAELIDALKLLPPMGELPGLALYRRDLLERAGIDVDDLDRWAKAHGGGLVQAGELKLRKGQRPEQGRTGRPQDFYAVPLDLLR